VENELLATFFEESTVPFAMLQITEDARIVKVNDAYVDFNKLTDAKSVEGHPIDTDPVFEIVKKTELGPLFDGFRKKTPIHSDFYHEGIGKWVQMSGFPVGEDHFAVIFRDTTVEHELEAEVEGFLNVNTDLLFVTDRKGRIVKANRSFEELLGETEHHLAGRSYLEFLHSDDKETTQSAFAAITAAKPLEKFVSRYRLENGHYCHLEWNAKSNGRYIYASGHDVTDRIEDIERLQHEAETDALTGLSNRRYFYQRIAVEMAAVNSGSRHLALISTDIDHFKKVNDTWGHPVGDDVLVRVSQHLSSDARKADVICRVGGEEFIILMPDTDIDQALVIAERLRIGLANKKLPIVGTVTASFGVTEMERNESFRSFYNRVDDAMYRAKTGGRNQVVATGFSEEDIITSAPNYFRWRNEWASGNEKIDRQHRALIEGSALLAKSIQSGENLMARKELVLKIIADITDHFHTEETILGNLGYPEIEGHRKIHETILSNARRIVNEFTAGKLKPSLMLTFLIDDFVIGHMLETDARYFPYLAETKTQTPTALRRNTQP